MIQSDNEIPKTCYLYIATTHKTAWHIWSDGLITQKICQMRYQTGNREVFEVGF